MPSGVYKRTKEHKLALKVPHPGSGGWNRGMTKETDFRVARSAITTSATLIGRILSPEHKAAIKEAASRPDVKAKCRAAKLGKCLGKDNGNWQGGITSLYNLLRNSNEYKRWRNIVFTKDNYTCQKCGKTGCYLEAHHKKPFINILRENNIKIFVDAINCVELWSIINGLTLCEKCHKEEKILTMKLIKEIRKEKLICKKYL